ncbi:HNH endonuclease family protein [Streptomyces sp. NPDC003860]
MKRRHWAPALVVPLALSSCSPNDAETSGKDDKRSASASAPAAAPSSGAPGGRTGGTTLADAIDQLPVATEKRAGYTRAAFKHWNAGLKPDGCDTRDEVLLAEAVKAPKPGAGCKLAGGSWRSYYDDTVVNAASRLDIDHMVPLAEAWDSGAYGWTAARREAYANDQGQAASLVAVTAKSNRSKADQDPAKWMPPSKETHCTYAADWVSTKLRWKLSADQDEVDALTRTATDCAGTTVAYEPAP